MGIMDLLKQLADGIYDAERTDSEMNGVSSGFYIDKGTPVKYREGKVQNSLMEKKTSEHQVNELRNVLSLMKRKLPSLTCFDRSF